MTFKVWHFACATCGHLRDCLQWDTDQPPICCDAPMAPESGGRATLQIITDDVPGGFTVSNGFRRPTTFYSKSAHRAALAVNGCKLAEKGEGGF